MSGLSDPLQYKKYFGQYSGDFNNQKEIELYDNLAAEMAGIKGIPIEYYTINVDGYADEMDPIYGDNDRPQWDRKYVLTGIIEEFSPELQAFLAIGEKQIDDITMYIHRSTFDKLVGIRSKKAPVTNTERRGAYGPIAKDEIRTIYNGLVYEVVTGGLHFMDSTAQTFGHKFWYKVTGKMRETSQAAFGLGEQRGALPEVIPLDPKYVGNPQFVLPSPTRAELDAADQTIQTVQPSGVPTQNPLEPVAYVTIGAPPGPSDGTVPDDILLPDGRVASKYKVVPEKDYSTNGDQNEIKEAAELIIDPQTDQPATPGPSGTESEYGPNGRTIKHDRDLFGDW
jgi:hypothetical protein